MQTCCILLLYTHISKSRLQKAEQELEYYLIDWCSIVCSITCFFLAGLGRSVEVFLQLVKLFLLLIVLLTDFLAFFADVLAFVFICPRSVIPVLLHQHQNLLFKLFDFFLGLINKNSFLFRSSDLLFVDLSLLVALAVASFPGLLGAWSKVRHFKRPLSLLWAAVSLQNSAPSGVGKASEWIDVIVLKLENLGGDWVKVNVRYLICEGWLGRILLTA